jgi:transposase
MNKIVDTMTTEKKRTRRTYSPELKAQILANCNRPGASVAQVAMAHGINANIVHGWRKHCRESVLTPLRPVAEFIPIAVDCAPAGPPPEEPDHVAIELHRAGLVMKLSWPLSATDQLLAWTRELLR